MMCKYIFLQLPSKNLFKEEGKKYTTLNISRDICWKMSWTSLKARNSRPGKSKKKVAAAAGSLTKVPVIYTG